jgi:3-isopropylmalate dehydratase small subunit
MKLFNTKNLFIVMLLMTASFTNAQDVAKKDVKTICLHKGENTGCGPTRADAKHALKMAIDLDNKHKKDSIAKIPKKMICLYEGENSGCGSTKAEAKRALKMAIELDTKKKKDSIAKIQKK